MKINLWQQPNFILIKQCNDETKCMWVKSCLSLSTVSVTLIPPFVDYLPEHCTYMHGHVWCATDSFKILRGRWLEGYDQSSSSSPAGCKPVYYLSCSHGIDPSIFVSPTEGADWVVTTTVFNFIHSFCSLSYDRYVASSKASSPHSAI